MPPFLPRAEGVWGPAPRRVCAARSLPDILTHLCSGAPSPLPAKPNTNASFTRALCHMRFQWPLLLKAPPLQGQSEAVGGGSPYYCSETRDNGSFSNHPVALASTRHEVKQSSSLRAARGAFLFKDQPLQMVSNQPFTRNLPQAQG